MRRNRVATLAISMIVTLILSACASGSADVASLNGTDRAGAAPATAEPADRLAFNEAKMMAFAQCMRDQGIAAMDPVVDSDGNFGKPEIAEGADGKALGAAWEACQHHLEGFIQAEERVDRTEELEEAVALAACLSEGGHELFEPTMETLDQWWAEMKRTLDLKDPNLVRALEECTGSGSGEGKGK